MPSVSNLGLKTPRCARSAESLGPGGKKKTCFHFFHIFPMELNLGICQVDPLEDFGNVPQVEEVVALLGSRQKSWFRCLELAVPLEYDQVMT